MASAKRPVFARRRPSRSCSPDAPSWVASVYAASPAGG